MSASNPNFSVVARSIALRVRERAVGRTLWLACLAPALALAGCSSSVGDDDGLVAGAGNAGYSNPGAGAPAHAGTNAGGATSSGGTSPGAGGPSVPPTGGNAPIAGGPVACPSVSPGPSPLRRLTTYEFNNTMRDLLGDTTSPGRALPPQIDSKHNIFGNDATEQAPTSLLVEKYQSVAEEVAARATADATALGKLHECARNVSAANEEACAKSIAATIGARAWRRVLSTAEVDELVGLYRTVRGLGASITFASGVAAMLEVMLQAPEFVYRIEQGTPDPTNPAIRRVAGREMATRLSYLLWQTMPDPALFEVADSGMLDTKEGVLNQARKMLDHDRARGTVAFFFDNLLPIADLGALTRDAELYPTFSSAIGVAMRQEVQELLKQEIFGSSAPVGSYAAGSWPAILTAPHTYVNEALFKFYGPSTFAPGTTVTGSEFRKVNLNTQQRLGLLTLGGINAGGTTSNLTNPVLRGAFILNKVMCMHIELPAGLSVSPPEPYTGKTARERFTKHSEDDSCAACHRVIDPMGFPFENYDAVGVYREKERWTDPMTQQVHETPIDATGSVFGVEGKANNAVELVQLLAKSEAVGTCFAENWMQFAYGRTIDKTADACNIETVQSTFKGAGYNIKQLLLALTQTDAFLYRTAE